MAIKQEVKNPLSLVIVGESPGKQELRLGVPFVGPSGRLLRRLCKSAGLDKDRCNITNVVDVLPPKYGGFNALKKDVIDAGVQRLKRTLEEWMPNCVLAVGGHAFKALTGLDGITKYRGAVTESTLVPGLKVIGTLHPANLLRGNMQMAPIVALDIQKAVRESKYPELRIPKRNYRLVTDVADLRIIWKRCKDREVVVDIETCKGALTCFGIATSPQEAVVVPHELCHDPECLVVLDGFCRDKSIKKIFHNACYDVLWLAYYAKILCRNIYFDTMLAQHVCYPTWNKSLAFCASLFTDDIYWKDEGKQTYQPQGRKDWDILYRYNANDVMITYDVYLKLNEELKENDLEKTFALDMALIRPVLFAMLKGIKIDEQARLELLARVNLTIDALEELKAQVIPDVNVKSPKQLKELFYDKWGFSPIKRKGKATTDAKAFQKLEALPTPYQPIIGLIRVLKDYYKRRSFCEITKDSDDRVRTSFKIAGTVSGRLASSTGITGSGTNLQNQPKLVRSMFVPDKGKIFIQADLSQAEARIVASLCGDREWLRQFDEEDVHWIVAEHLFGKPREQLVKHVHRQMGKRISHGTHYKMSWTLLKELLRVTAKDAKRLMADYYELRPNLALWQEAVSKQVMKEREIRTPYGRRLIYPVMPDENDIRQAISFVPQSTCAQYNNNAWIRGHEQLDYAEILLQVHDSLLYMVDDNLEIVKQTLNDVKRLTEVPLIVESPVTKEKIEMIIPVDFEIGYDWKNLKECTIDNVEEIYYGIHNN